MPPRIDPKRCDGCGICIYECGVEALAFRSESDKAYLAKPNTCVDCYICQEVCPADAIVIRPHKRSQVGKPA